MHVCVLWIKLDNAIPPALQVAKPYVISRWLVHQPLIISLLVTKSPALGRQHRFDIIGWNGGSHGGKTHNARQVGLKKRREHEIYCWTRYILSYILSFQWRRKYPKRLRNSDAFSLFPFSRAIICCENSGERDYWFLILSRSFQSLRSARSCTSP